MQPPLIAECAGHLECQIVETFTVTTHDLLICEVVYASAEEEFFDGAWIPEKFHTLHYMKRTQYGLLDRRVDAERGLHTRPRMWLQRMHVRERKALAMALSREGVHALDALRHPAREPRRSGQDASRQQAMAARHKAVTRARPGQVGGPVSIMTCRMGL